MNSTRFFWRLAATGLLGILAACSSPSTGNLKVTVTTPTGVSLTPNVKVTGPDAFDKTVDTAGDTTIPSLKPGDYTITVNKVVSDGSGYSADSGTASVTAGADTPFLVEYKAISGAAAVSVSGVPTGQTTSVVIKKGTTAIGSPITGNTSSPILLSELAAGTYTVEAPPIVVGNITYVVALGSFTVTNGVKAAVNIIYAAGTGAMTVTINGLPVGVSGNVAVAKQGGGFNQTLTATTTIPNLAPGTYDITVNEVTNNGDAYGGTNPASVVVNGGATSTATVTYAQIKARVAATISGLGATTGFTGTITLTPKAPTTGSAITKSFTGDGAVNIDGVPLGTYDAVATTTAHTGTYVDSAALSTATVALNTTTPTLALPFSAFASGRLFVAGNGAFDNGTGGAVSASDGGFSITDAGIASATPTFDTLTGATLSGTGLMRIAFDKSGNLYAMYQFINNGNKARILRITAANLAAGKLAATDTGNSLINDAALGGGSVEPADLAFDTTGNMWVATDSQNKLICISKTAMDAGNVITPSANYGSTSLTRTQGTFNKLMDNIHAIEFDGSGNLWFTAGDFRADIVTAPDTVTFGRRSVLARIKASSLVCSGGAKTLTDTDIPVRLDISNDSRQYVDGTPLAQTVNPPSPYGSALFKPVTLVLAPDGNSLWIGDFGGGNGFTAADFLDAGASVESVIQVTLSAANTADTVTTAAPDGYNLRFAVFSDRITIPAVSGTNRGMQQVFGLAFDRAGKLWVATNNNVTVPATKPGSMTQAAYDAAGVTDRKGKLYQITLTTPPGGFINTPRSVTADKTLSAPTDGTGFVGIAFNLPNPTTPKQ